MKTYKITWNQLVYRKPNKKDFYAEIKASSLEDCKDKIRTQLRLNPFYLLIDGHGIDTGYKGKEKQQITLTF